jgi:hypothetical protein
MKKKSSKNNKYGWWVMVKGKLIPVEEWQRQPTDSEIDRRRIDVKKRNHKAIGVKHTKEINHACNVSLRT